MSALQVALEVAISGRPVPPADLEAAIAEVMEGAGEPLQLAALLGALAARGETVDELAAAARALRARGGPSPLPETPDLLDTCGTGGDGLDTPNVSTMVALVAASAGIKVAKHGNRSVSSRCGSADLLEALGVPVDPGPEAVRAGFEAAGIAFLFAPRYHSALRHAAAVRKALRVRTLFNLLGPLANPARATRQVLGVYRADLTQTMAWTLRLLGVERALVVHGSDGMDELTTSGPSTGHFLDQGSVVAFRLEPRELGIEPAPEHSLRGGDPQENARIAREALAGRGPVPIRDLVALNAAAALRIGGRADDWAAGLALARELLADGAPARTLERWKAALLGRPG